MASNAQLYQSTAITNATIVTDAPTIVATVPGVAVNNYGSIVNVTASVSLTPGADCDSVTLEVRRNTVAGTQLGADVYYGVTAAVADTMGVIQTAQEPVGTHSYVIVATCNNASANTTVTAVTVTVTVGN